MAPNSNRDDDAGWDNVGIGIAAFVLAIFSCLADSRKEKSARKKRENSRGRQHSANPNRPHSQRGKSRSKRGRSPTYTSEAGRRKRSHHRRPERGHQIPGIEIESVHFQLSDDLHNEVRKKAKSAVKALAPDLEFDALEKAYDSIVTEISRYIFRYAAIYEREANELAIQYLTNAIREAPTRDREGNKINTIVELNKIIDKRAKEREELNARHR